MTNRHQRPNIELCRDEPAHRLIEEVTEIEDSIRKLEQKVSLNFVGVLIHHKLDNPYNYLAKVVRTISSASNLLLLFCSDFAVYIFLTLLADIQIPN